MPKAKHQSPRAAIEQWLLKSSKAYPPERELSVPPLPLAEDLSPLDKHCPQVSHEYSTQKQPRKKLKAYHVSRHQEHYPKGSFILPAFSPRNDSQGSKGEHNKNFLLPDRLDTQRESQICLDDAGFSKDRQGLIHRSQKRKRPVSLHSASLRLAAAAGIHGLDDNPYKNSMITQDDPPTRRLLSASNSNTFSSSLCASPPLPKAYERQRRHKTREDRYETRHTKNLKNQPNARKGTTQRRKKRRGMEKSGAVHIHDFKAPNVSHDRLTVMRYPLQ